MLKVIISYSFKQYLKNKICCYYHCYDTTKIKKFQQFFNFWINVFYKLGINNFFNKRLDNKYFKFLELKEYIYTTKKK